MHRFFLCLSLLGCGQTVGSQDASDASSGAVLADASAPTTDTGTTDAGPPRRVTLTVAFTGPGGTASERLDLETGTLLPADATGGDLQLMETRVISLRAPTPESVCMLGTFGSLGEIPTATDQCLTGVWVDAWTLGGSTLGTDQFVGSSMLLRNAGHTAMYRLRVASDQTDSAGTRMTVEYDRVPWVFRALTVSCPPRPVEPSP